MIKKEPEGHFGGPGFAGSDPGCGPIHCSSSHAVVACHIEELGGPTTRIYNHAVGSSGEKKKRGRLATYVNSGPIFQKKKCMSG